MKTILNFTVAGVAAMAGAAQAETTIRFGHMNSPTHFVNTAISSMAEAISTRTDGEVVFEMFPSGQLGETSQVVEQIALGSDMASQVGPGSIANFVPDFDIIAFPFMYDGMEDAQRLLDSDVIAELEARAEAEANIKVMCYFAFGIRDLYTRETEVHAPEDMAGLSVRVQPVTMYTELVKQVFGAAPTPMPWPDVYSALAQGVIDAAEAPPAAILDQRHYESARYLIQTNHILDISPIVIAASTFNGLAEDQQAIVLEEAEVACGEMTAAALGGYEAGIEELRANGMTIISDIDRAAFSARAAGIADSFPDWSEGLFERARAAIDG